MDSVCWALCWNWADYRAREKIARIVPAKTFTYLTGKTILKDFSAFG
jgi:hypothetical protein